MKNLRRFWAIVFLSSFACLAGEDWPQWLGPTRDGHAASAESISKLPPDLQPLWRKNIGGGFSSPVVANKKLIYFDEDGAKEVVHLLDATSGKEIWNTPIAEKYQDEWGAGPRSTPILDNDRCYVQSCNGEFRCLSLKDGKVLWGRSFEKDFGVKFLGNKANEGTAARRGNNGSGVIDGNSIIVPVGSRNGATLVCFDKLSGEVLWKSGQDEAAYSSPQIAIIADTKQVVYLSAEALAGFDFLNGKILWRVPIKTNAKRHAATPVIIGDRVIVNSQTVGLLCLKISRAGADWKAVELWNDKKLKINLATPVVSGDFLFSQGPVKNFVCADVKSGEVQWEQPGFGKDYSSIIVAGKNLLVLTDEGQLVLIAADPVKYSELGRQQICGKNWNYPAYAEGKLYVRDSRELVCYDLFR